MKRLAVIIAALIAALVCFQCAVTEQLVTISLLTPKVGDEIRVFYHSTAKASVLREAKDIMMQALVMRSTGMPLLMEVPLKPADGAWQGSFKLADEQAQAIFFKFVSGEKVDDNQANAWNVMVYGKDGKPVKGALLVHGQFLINGSIMEFKGPKNLSAGMADCRRELEFYPDNLRAQSALWSAEMTARPGDETKAALRKKVDAFYEAQKNNQDALGTIFSWMTRVGDKDRAESLRKMWIDKDPKGKIAEAARQNQIFSEKDPDKKAELIDRFLADFPKKPADASMYRINLVNAYLQAKKFDKVEKLLEHEESAGGNTYNSMAWSIIEKGDKKPELEKAVGWAKRGIDIMKSGKESKPTYMSNSDWKKSSDYSLGMITDTYAFGLFKLGKKKEAEELYAEAARLTEGGDANINERYVEACVANGNYEKALSLAAGYIQQGMSTDKLLENFKAAYVKLKGSDKGFEDAVNKAKLAALEKTRKELLKDRVDKPAVEFALKSLDGSTVKLADLHGKVVVVDFWATWCGPCKESFPYLQKVHEKYKENPNVRIFALDTWESETGAKREDLVKKFIADNKYTFPVLYDEGMVEKYGVDGIPTKFILDKNGRIQFKSIGFEGGQKMMDEMTIAIDTLLRDEFYSKK
jgi:thiol-disulfide isomerase/thioredoxin